MNGNNQIKPDDDRIFEHGLKEILTSTPSGRVPPRRNSASLISSAPEKARSADTKRPARWIEIVLRFAAFFTVLFLLFLFALNVARQ